MHFIGLLGMPRRIYTYDPALGLDTMNLVATVGAFLMAAGTLVFLVNVWWSRTRGQPAGSDPWGGATLEWAIPSPPPAYNFTEIPQVASRLPRWTQQGMRAIPEVPPAPVHVPGGSYWPVVTASAIVIVAIGAVIKTLLVVLGGAALLVVGIYAWAFEPFEA
jgi:cytochrome c oxidase subunit 1